MNGAENLAKTIPSMMKLIRELAMTCWGGGSKVWKSERRKRDVWMDEGLNVGENNSPEGQRGVGMTRMAMDMSICVCEGGVGSRTYTTTNAQRKDQPPFHRPRA